MGRGMIHPVSVVVSVRPVGLLDAGVAVIAAVSGHLIGSSRGELLSRPVDQDL
jgi:hypothetical protein